MSGGAEEGQPGDRRGARSAGSRPATQVRRGGKHPIPGLSDRSLLRVRGPHPQRVRRPDARPRGRDPRPRRGRQEVGLTDSLPAEDAGVRYDAGTPVARLTLARPDKRNAQTPEMWLRLSAIADALPSSTRAVVVAAEGPSFSAGLDRSMFGTLPGQLAEGDSAFLDLIASYQAGFSWLRRPEFVSVAAVQGHAVGAGFQLALACDVRIATEDAQFTMAETQLGLVPDLGGTQVLVDLVGYGRAVEICTTGRRVGAREAFEIGLVNAVVPAGELGAAVEDLVAAIAAAPHGAVSMTQVLLLSARGRSYPDQLLAERQAQLMMIRALVQGTDGTDTHT